jgi:pimeloyl-ACP methyl ester carboxylesterase
VGGKAVLSGSLDEVPSFRFRDQRIAYTEYGGGPAAVTGAGGRGRTAKSSPAATRPLILVHGLLLSQDMHRPLAENLAARGNRVITVDLLGHGKSDRPRDMWRYSMGSFAEQLLALMDHLQIEQAVVMGTSLGANAALEIASAAPERLRGMVIEMPVLDNALLWSALTFTPLLVALTFGEPVMKLLARGTRAVPRRLLPHYGNVLLDVVRQEPGPGGAVLQGLFFGRVAPHRSERRTFQTPALVLGHRRDPVHPFSDAGHLAEELPNGRLLEADSLVELRLHPERLTEEIASFLDEVWGARRTGARRQAKRAG